MSKQSVTSKLSQQSQGKPMNFGGTKMKDEMNDKKKEGLWASLARKLEPMEAEMFRVEGRQGFEPIRDC